MQEKKYDNLLNVSIVILIVSAIMLAVTGYNIFSKDKNPLAAKHTDPAMVRDSLQKVYSGTVKAIDNNLQMAASMDPDKEAQVKFAEMITLRGEIDSLLKQHGSEADLATAKIKIEELQLKVAELQNRYTNVESENKRLQALINQLIRSDRTAIAPGNTTATSNTGSETQTITPAEKRIATTTAGASVAGLHLFAVAENNSKEQETFDADEAEKIIGSFSLKNLSSKATGEVVVVVLQPDGRVVKNSVWESGTFETREGKKIYSRKIFFEPSADEKQLNFSLTPEKFQKGEYTMQVWYNGSLMGKVVKVLS